MGDQTGRGDIDEDPVHVVNLSESFYIGIFEVTQAQWELVMGDTPSMFTAPGSDALPVEQVSFDDIQGFLSTLSSRIGRTVLLPTEAQWEYSCKAGTSTDWSFGRVADPAYMWTVGQSETTNIVGLKAPNLWGLYDMHGNVWEWCSDWYDKNYYSSAPLVDPENSTPGAYRVYRGGGWTSSSHLCRSSNRVRNLSTSRFPFLGFRCVAVR
jgi:formylglycine-generating enzyme required for sulfatase activity